LLSSDSVFSGRVMSVNKISDSETQVMFCTQNVWKGQHAGYYRIRTCSYDACCGNNFQIGQNYLVYAYRNGFLWTNICTRTKLLNMANEDLGQLGHASYTGTC
jgi:hypothetical protein